ncbi:MAG: (d)CMP kinase [Bacteroidetes bacterium]|nr:(d)CMP kinase [Bacteroidota bacterium]MBP6403659.1 (d)CMP kinase [Bacteroidia bacterium]MBK6839052.1 (d)CMP kinase [Bacteroidota bacterium]MBK9525739.1 (d)CMP kinase [Bacteroidota bacterium]MBK9540698.1 (d)CMP kinase [Bacteroidota bacterium]
MQEKPSVKSQKIIIAIDGYSSCGKSTLAKALAKKLAYSYIDSGAMYRAVTLFIQQHDISLSQLEEMTQKQMEGLMDNIQISFHVNPDSGLSEVFLNGLNVEKRIRDLKVSDWVSPVSAIHEIRHRMVELQKGYGSHKGIVMDGRDIGTEVFPKAELKIFMTAKKEIRAKRRFDELNSKGFMVTLDEVMKNIQDRDYTDTHRSESPLRQAEDAIILDNSNLTEQEQFQFALNLIKELNVPIPV